jgi:oxaloacetate decarboxylase (Na+ extruding) subunit alpha
VAKAKRARRPARTRKGGRPAVKSAGPSADNASGRWTGREAIAELQRLIRLVKRTGIGELEISEHGRTVRIAAQAGSSAGVPAPTVVGPVRGGDAPMPAAEAKSVKAETHTPITSPMVGTFYRAPAPDADPYVEVGDIVEVGQTVCIIEAMKLMNEIESEVRGRVVQILAENAQPVEFGQKLFLVEPV